MTKAGFIGVALVLAVLAAWVGWQASRARERRELFAWIDQYRVSREGVERDEWLAIGNSVGPKARQIDKAAEQAIRRLGSVPAFLAMLKTRESSLRVQLAALVDHFGSLGLFHSNSGGYQAQLEKSRRLGAYGLVALGSEARTAVPELIELVKQRDEGIRWHAISVLGCLGPEAREAVPALTECLSDPAVSPCAVIALGLIHQQPEQVVPLLTHHIERNRDRALAIAALSRFGPDAKPAVPLLAGFLRDKDRPTRFLAIKALKVIDPETAAEAQGNDKSSQPAAAVGGDTAAHLQMKGSGPSHH